MSAEEQRARAEQFRRMHLAPPMLVVPNAWDAASAAVLAHAGARAIATTSSGVAAALGYKDGQRITREMLIEVIARVTRVVDCPVTADIEAGYGDTPDEVLRTVRAVIDAGAVGINIEDSRPARGHALVDVPEQARLIQALRGLAAEVGVPLVINARVDVFLHGSDEPAERIAEAARRGNAYLEAGADCVYPIGRLGGETIAALVGAINGPINVLGGPPEPELPELARLGVARVTFGSRLLTAALGHLRAIAHELLEHGTYTRMSAEALPGAEFSALFAD